MAAVAASPSPPPTSGRRTWKQRLAVPDERNGAFETNQWINHDLMPMPSYRRTWGPMSYVIYWLTGGFAIYNYSTGSALISYGLSGRMAIGCIVFSPICLGLLCVACGWMGASHHIGFTVNARGIYGIRGSFFAVAVRMFPGLIWDAIEAFWGGQAISTMIASWAPKWRTWDYPLANGALQLNDFIGFIIYYIIFLAVMWLKPEKMKVPFAISCVGFTAVVIGMMAWAYTNSNGSMGPYFASDYSAPALAGNLAWAWWFGATAILGNTAVVTLAQADWTRFAKSTKGPMWTQLFICPIAIFLVALFGILITSAATVPLGKAVWQPFLLLRDVQAYHNDSPRSRAGVFFGAAAIAFAQVCVNIILNSTSAAMDLTAVAPKYINIRRGAYIIAAIGLICQPWQLTVSAAQFLNVLAGFGIFYGPLSGILMADFWIIKRQRINVRDLYLAKPESQYWYWHGFNWRPFVAFLLSIIPALPGYILGTQDLTRPVDAYSKITNLGFLVGCALAALLYLAFNFIFPVPHAHDGDKQLDDATLILPSAYDQTRPTLLQDAVFTHGDFTASDAHSDEEKKY